VVRAVERANGKVFYQDTESKKLDDALKALERGIAGSSA
jgi:hypothetical protein